MAERFAGHEIYAGYALIALACVGLGTSFGIDKVQPAAPEKKFRANFIADLWQNWLSWDPLTLAEKHLANLKKLKLIYVDCGDIDQYNLVYGARRMHAFLDRHSVEHTYEEFSDNHSSVDYRMDRSLPLLAKALTQ